MHNLGQFGGNSQPASSCRRRGVGSFAIKATLLSVMQIKGSQKVVKKDSGLVKGLGCNADLRPQ